MREEGGRRRESGKGEGSAAQPDRTLRVGKRGVERFSRARCSS